MSEGGEYTDQGGYRHTYSTVYRGKQRYIDGARVERILRV